MSNGRTGKGRAFGRCYEVTRPTGNHASNDTNGGAGSDCSTELADEAVTLDF